MKFIGAQGINSRILWPHESAAAHLLGLWVRIPPVAWLIVSCECCVLSNRVLPSREVLPIVVCLNVFWKPHQGLSRHGKEKDKIHFLIM